MDVLFYLGVALVLNLPFGVWRARTRKLSPAWFTAIHAPIPGIIALRVVLDVPWAWVPAGIALAVVGQVIGARMLPAAPAAEPALAKADAA